MSVEDKPSRKARRGRIKKVVSSVAPQLAHALGGPLAGAAVSAIAGAVLGDEHAEEAAVEAALHSASASDLAALRSADYAFRTEIAKLAVDHEQIHASDRASARARQVSMGDWGPTALGVAIILGFFSVLGLMIAGGLPDDAQTEFSIMLGALATMTAAVVSYFFGSSAGSKEKTRLLVPGLNSDRLPAERDNMRQTPKT
ncbi:MAG: hypothetical protein AAF850_04830 [Pseudomonadota bacterium]